ncbi:CinA family protein [Campylobacter troglodytis]|uniref:CinA family protein n=1 Tax=Campylobacter troglodytis TaxID=654363 RepID=UPI00115B7A49|nr:CinA family protein [Campylobacter troglodytis]TQR61575.1 CinA family protein [Campylobacter troglodytis]
MRHLLLIIGAKLKLNKNYKDYIIRQYKAVFKELNECLCFDKSTKELPFLLEAWSNEYDFITIFTSSELYGTNAKIVATLGEDSLVLKNELLVPSKAIKWVENSFLMQIGSCQINVLKSSINEKLPPLLCEVKHNFDFFCLRDMDEESVLILLDSLAKSYEIELLSLSLLENLVLIKAVGAKFSNLESFLQATKTLFNQKIIWGADPIEFIASKLIEKKLKISFAESCTAGLCASELARFNGISAIFEGSLISYSNRLKNEWLGVSELVLQNEYSDKCVYFMLKGTFKTSDCDFALAISGVAGDSDDRGVKAGTVFIGAMYRDGSFLQESLHFKGDRNFVRYQTVLASFMLMIKLKPEIFF